MNYLEKHQKIAARRSDGLKMLVIAFVLIILLLWLFQTSVFMPAMSMIPTISSFYLPNLRSFSTEVEFYPPYQPLGRSPSPIKENTGQDKLDHLGGWVEYDAHGVSNMTWNYMMGILGIKSVLDIGCGVGYSTKYFYDHGARVLCIEGSHEAVVKTLLPSPTLVVEHDYTRGPYWPEETFDACWSIEFLEHVSRQYFKNYINSFRKCALIFVTVSAWGGHHHVEIHSQHWWLGRFAGAGFLYQPQLTESVKKLIIDEKEYLREALNVSSTFHNQVGPVGQYILNQLLIFVNPYVASLPQHDHVFAGDGCYGKSHQNLDGGVPCKGEDKLPEKYNSLMRCFKDREKMIELKKSIQDMYWTCVRNT